MKLSQQKKKKRHLFTKIVSLLVTMSIIMLSVFAGASADSADITAPSEADVLSDITAKLSSATVKHPYIHGTYNGLETIKANVAAGDKYTQSLYGKVLANADSLLSTAAVAHNGSVSQSLAAVESRIITLYTAYFVSENSAYLTRALNEFANLQSITDWTAAAQLDNTQTAAVVAVGYDWLYDHLSATQKEWAVKVIKEKCLDIAYAYYKDPSCLAELRAANDDMNIVCGRGSYNHCTYNNSNLTLCALAVAPLYPEYCAYIISNNFYNVQPYMELIGDGGGHEEPMGYYGYTTGKIVNMLSAVSSALGTMYGYEQYPGFKTTAYYPLYMYGAGPFSFGDCAPDKAYFDTNFLYFTAAKSQNTGLMKLLADRFENGDCAKPLLWYTKGELDGIGDAEQLSLDRVLSPVSKGQNVASFHDTWDNDKGFFAAMYTGCATANGHSDAVSGAFCLDAFGERFVTPIGLGNYDYPDYWNSAQNGGRWNWYEKRPEGAGCLVINPSTAVGQDVSVTAVFDKFESGAASGYAVTDLSEVYGDYVTSYTRGMKVHDNRSKIVVQDEAVMKSASEIFWSFNTPAQIEILSSDTALLTNNGKYVMVKFYSNVDFTLYEMAAEKLSTSPQMSEQRTFPGYRKLALKADGVTELKLMAEFTPVASKYELPQTMSAYESMSLWSADDDLAAKPTLDAIYVGGKAVENFESDRYVYEVTFDTLPDEAPAITFDNSLGYDVEASYTESGELEAIIEVSGNGRKAYYVIKLTQLPPDVTIYQTTVTSDKFKSAMYSASDSTGITTHTNGWLPHLYANGTYRQFYCKVDISELAGKSVTSAIYNVRCEGDMNISVYGLDGELNPGTTTYANLPAFKEVIARYNTSDTSSRYIQLDFTEYIKKLIEAGSAELKFAIVQNDASTTHLAGESSWSSWLPYISVSYYIPDEPLVISDFDISNKTSGMTAAISVENNTGLCLNGYALIMASYSDSELVEISVDRSGRIMPYRAKKLSVSLDAGDEVRVYLWNTLNGLIPVKEVRVR